MAEVITIFGKPGGDSLIGEDTVELLERIEKAFGIRFAETDGFPDTVGKLCGLVKSHLPGNRTSKCTSSVTFYALRRAISKAIVCSRASITPSTKLATLLATGGNRQVQWEKIEKQLALRMPRLVFSGGVEACFTVVHYAAAMTVVFYFLPKLRLAVGARIWMIFLTGLGALISWAMARATLQPLATQLPLRCETVGELVKSIVSKNYGSVAARAGGWNDVEVWDALRRLIADETLIGAEEITPETSFPDGLNIF